MDEIMLKRDRNGNRTIRKMIGTEGDAVVEEAVGEAHRGGRRQRQRLFKAQARTLHLPTCLTLRSLLEDLVRSGATTMSNGEGHRFGFLIRGCLFMCGGESFADAKKLVKLVGIFVAYREIYLCIALVYTVREYKYCSMMRLAKMK